MTGEVPINPESFVHPRQMHLWNKLRSNLLPDGAAELIKDSIREYQDAFGSQGAVSQAKSIIDTDFSSKMETDGPATILAGKSHIVTAQFGEDGQPIERLADLFGYVSVVLRLKNMRGTEIYPDWVRYLAIDVLGRTKPAKFVLRVPEHLRGNAAEVRLAAFSGPFMVGQHTFAFGIV